MQRDDEDTQLRAMALQNVQSVLRARQRAEQELRETKEALAEETRVLELLNDAGATLASNLDLPRVVQAVTDAATELSGAQFGAFFESLGGAKGEVFSLYALSGDPRAAFEKLGDPRVTPLLRPTFRGEGVVRIGDVCADARYGTPGSYPAIPCGHLPVRSYLAVSVVSRSGAVFGGLFFGHESVDVFTERSERLIVGVAAHAAIAIDNAQLYEEAKRSAEERARLLDAERATRVELERVGVLKDEFLATLSHELRTPLNAVLGWSDILLARVPVDSDLRRGLEAIGRNARAQARLIEDLLDMNRIVSGKLRLDVQRMDLAPVVGAAVDAVRPSAAAKSIVLRAAIDPDAGPVFGDPNRLQQVVWNLLSNAVKFTPKGGKIDVVVRRVEAHFEVAVQDTGVGIPREFLPYLFERFRQADSSTTRTYGGLGIGLSIVKQLVELHGGSVHAESRGPGHGATFVVSLPLRTLLESESGPGYPATTERDPIAPAARVSLAGLVVLVVDDEPDARDLVMFALTAASATVIVASSADEGVELVKANAPDVVVSDLGMPDRDGYQFIRDVRNLDPSCGGRTPAIALTAFARSEDRTRAMLAGYQVHLSKPIEPGELVAAIRSLAATRPSPR